MFAERISMKKSTQRHALTPILMVVLMYITYFYVMTEIRGIGDYRDHVYVYPALLSWQSLLSGWSTIPHCLWHLLVKLVACIPAVPIEAAGAYVSAALSGATYLLIAYLLTCVFNHFAKETESGKRNTIVASILSFCLCIIEPIGIYWFSAENQYLGQFSLNPMHNPTHMCTKPFAVLCFMLAVDLLGLLKDSSYKGIFFDTEKGAKRLFVLLSVSLFFSAVAKPTFAEMFIPTVAILMLIEWIERLVKKDDAKPYFISCLWMLLAAAPAILYGLLSTIGYFLFGGSYGVSETHLVVTGFMESWKLLSDNIIASILLSMGFPLLMIWLDAKYYVTSTFGRIGVLGYVIGMLESSLLGESTKLSQGNMMWPMMSGMLLLWIVCSARLVVLERNKQSLSKFVNVMLQIAWGLFTLYVLSGTFYLWAGIFA